MFDTIRSLNCSDFNAEWDKICSNQEKMNIELEDKLKECDNVIFNRKLNNRKGK